MKFEKLLHANFIQQSEVSMFALEHIAIRTYLAGRCPAAVD